MFFMENEHEYDVIVAGAGPGGATTATILAQKGYDVLLLDRETFPRDKTCGDAVPIAAIGLMDKLGMGEAIDKAKERGEFYELEKMRLISPNGKMINADFEVTGSCVAPRYYFDTIIKEHAVKSGAEFKQAVVKGPLVDDDGCVIGVNAQLNGSAQPIRSKVVVGADGVTSTITRSLRPKENKHVDKHRAVAVRAYINDLDVIPHEVEFYLYDEILPGYSWIFPLSDNRANIGLGMRLDYFRKEKKDLKDLLRQFLDMPDIKKRLKRGGELEGVKSWQLNFGSQKKLQHAFDGALLVGDAAGFINPLTGGGIHNAMISASMAAQTIEEAFVAGDTSREFMKIYENRCHDKMWPSMRFSFFIQRWMIRFPKLLDILIGNLDEKGPIAKTFMEKL
jgi:geranylgeranyl reductase family protein